MGALIAIASRFNVDANSLEEAYANVSAAQKT
jgi:hypothetical protein